MPDIETITARHPQPVAPSVPQTIVGSLKSKYSVPNGAQTIATAVKQIPESIEEAEAISSPGLTPIEPAPVDPGHE